MTAIFNSVMRVPSFVAWIATLIYRRFGSPNKGYRCAHGVLHGTSCSDVGLELFRTEPIHKAIKGMRQQFGACATAKRALDLRASTPAVALAAGHPGSIDLPLDQAPVLAAECCNGDDTLRPL